MPAKRRHAVGKMKRTSSRKTKKRLDAKRVMLEVKAKSRKGKK